MNKKWKTIFLTSFLVLLGATAVHSCSKDEDTDERMRLEMERKIARRSKIEENAFLYNTRDSILEANGYKKLERELIEGRDVFSDLNDIERLQFKSSLSGVMDQEVNTSGKQIILAYFSKIQHDLTKFGVVLPDNWYRNVYVSFGDLSFIGAGEDANESGYGNIGVFSYNELKNYLENAIDESGIQQKQQAKQSANNNLGNMRSNLISNRHSIEQKYADYYLLDDRDIKYLGATKKWLEDESVGSYRMLEQLNHKYIITSQGADFTLSGMPAAFFADKDAKYELIFLGGNNWKIRKTGSDGIVAETDEFTQEVEMYTDTYSSDKEEHIGSGHSYCDYSNGLVFVHFDKVINVQQRTKDWEEVINAQDKRRIDSLNQEVKKKENTKQQMIVKQREADSIANVITQQRFGDRVR